MTLLEIKNMSFESEGKQILKNINLSIQEGDFLAITGPSGSGKSTLLKIIASLLSHTDGEIFYQGKKQEDYLPSDYRKEVSYCFQSPVLFGETVADNLAFPFEIRNQEFDRAKAAEYLRSVALMPDDLNKNISSLSGGEKQRVALIRNILFQPKILLLDEVTSALDEKNREIIWEWLRELYQHAQMTFLMVSHLEEEAHLAPKEITMVAGSVQVKREENR